MNSIKKWLLYMYACTEFDVLTCVIYTAIVHDFMKNSNE